MTEHEYQLRLNFIKYIENHYQAEVGVNKIFFADQYDVTKIKCILLDDDGRNYRIFNRKNYKFGICSLSFEGKIDTIGLCDEFIYLDKIVDADFFTNLDDRTLYDNIDMKKVLEEFKQLMKLLKSTD